MPHRAHRSQSGVPDEAISPRDFLDSANPIEEILSFFDIEDQGFATLIHNQLVMIRELRAFRGVSPRPDIPGGRFVPEVKEVVFNRDATSGEDVLADDITPRLSGILRTTVSPDTAAVFKTSLDSGDKEVVVDLNQGAALDSNSLFTFDIPVSSDLRVNYEFDSDLTANILLVQEINVAGP